MTSTFRDKPVIVISAPHGALGKYLAALLEYATNQNVADPALHNPDQWSKTRNVQSFYTAYEDYVFGNNEGIKELNDYIDSSDTLEDIAELETRVLHTRLDPVDIAKVFTNCKIIKINIEDSDSNQLGYNHLVKEILPMSLNRTALEIYITKAKSMFDLESTTMDWDTVFSQGLMLDYPEIQFIVRSLGTYQCQTLPALSTGINPPTLSIGFSQLCDMPKTVRGENKESNDQSVEAICEFLKPFVRKDVEKVATLWHDFTNSISPYRTFS
jgi:hypothetical protein